MTDFDFDFDEDAPEFYEYYLMNDLPLRITSFNQAPILAEIIDFENKTLKIDNTIIIKFIEASDVIEIDEQEFVNKCLSLGIAPHRKTSD